MQLRWEQMERQFSTRVGAEWVRLQNQESTEVATRRPVSRSTNRLRTSSVRPSLTAESDRLSPLWSALALFISLLVVTLYLTICFHLTGPAATFALTALPVGLVVVGCLPHPRNSRSSIPRGRLSGEQVVRAAFKEVAVTRAERLYADIILLLLKSEERLSRPHARLRKDLLRQCNSLLADYARIETYRKRLWKLLETTDAPEEIAEERLRLTARLDAEVDSIARRALEDSIALCDERQESAHSTRPLLARLDAHSELICQALALARSVLVRAQATPLAMTPPDVSGLRASVRRISAESRAVEEAVSEMDSWH